MAAATRHADGGVAEGAGGAAAVLSGRRRERAAGPAPPRGAQERDREPVASAARECDLRAHDRAGSVLAPRRPAAASAGGQQVSAMFKHRCLWLLIAAPIALAAQAQDVVESSRGETVERNLPTDEPLRAWALDPKLLQKESGDRVEM